jgi:hypothetical protein
LARTEKQQRRNITDNHLPARFARIRIGQVAGLNSPDSGDDGQTSLDSGGGRKCQNPINGNLQL